MNLNTDFHSDVQAPNEGYIYNFSPQKSANLIDEYARSERGDHRLEQEIADVDAEAYTIDLKAISAARRVIRAKGGSPGETPARRRVGPRPRLPSRLGSIAPTTAPTASAPFLGRSKERPATEPAAMAMAMVTAVHEHITSGSISARTARYSLKRMAS